MKRPDHRVLLTGARGGIGQAMAVALRQAGAQVMGVGRGPAPPGPAPWVSADLAHPDGLERASRAAAAWGANTVVHAAGLPAFGAVANLSPQEATQVLQTNLWAPMLLTQQLLPHLRTLPEARVVFVGSVLGRIGLPGYALYGASKAGLHGFAEALRRELRGSPVHVQWLAPRATRTAFNSPAAQAYADATGTQSDPPERVAQALLALLDGTAAERHIGWPERWLVRLNAALGPLLDGGFKQHQHALFSPVITKEL